MVVPSSLSWLFPSDILSLVEVSELSAILKQPTETRCSEIQTKLYDEFYEVEAEPVKKEIKVFYKLFECKKDMLVAVIMEDDTKYPLMLHNFLSVELSNLLRENSQQITVFINSDQVTGVKKLSELQPPEFIKGPVAAIVTALLVNDRKTKAEDVYIVTQSEGPGGFEKHNIGIVDSLVCYMKEEFSLSNEYLCSAYKSWKLHAGCQFQGGMYL